MYFVHQYFFWFLAKRDRRHLKFCGEVNSYFIIYYSSFSLCKVVKLIKFGFIPFKFLDCRMWISSLRTSPQMFHSSYFYFSIHHSPSEQKGGELCGVRFHFANFKFQIHNYDNWLDNNFNFKIKFEKIKKCQHMKW
jgi:hypothetical protein